MARWLWKTLWYFKICCCHILKAPTATSERKLTIRPRLKSTQNMINLDLEIMNESSELFFKGSKDEKGCSKSFFLFPRIVVSRVSSSFVCLRAIRFLSHHWILRDLRYLAWLHFIFAYQFEGNNKFSMGILLLPLPCQQTSAYNMKETMLKTKTKTDTNDNTNSSLHKLVHYSYE